MTKVTTTIETITPEMAVEYLKKNVGNRKLNKANAQYYARMMSEGQWMLNGESIIFDDKGNLSDGQTRLTGCIIANVPFQTVVVRNVESEAFLTIDKGKPRSSADSLHIKGIPNSTQIAASIRRFILMNRKNVSSMGAIATGSGTNSEIKISDQEILAAYNERPDYWQDEFSFASSCYLRHRLLGKADVMAISSYLQLTKGYNAEVVRDFFSQLFFEECTENNTLRLLRTTLVNDAMNAGKSHMSNLYKTQLLIKSWEAFKMNRVYEKLIWGKNERERVFR